MLPHNEITEPLNNSLTCLQIYQLINYININEKSDTKNGQVLTVLIISILHISTSLTQHLNTSLIITYLINLLMSIILISVKEKMLIDSVSSVLLNKISFLFYCCIFIRSCILSAVIYTECVSAVLCFDDTGALQTF